MDPRGHPFSLLRHDGAATLSYFSTLLDRTLVPPAIKTGTLSPHPHDASRVVCLLVRPRIPPLSVHAV